MDIQHSAFLTSAAPSAHHINQRLQSGKPVTSSSATFPMCIDHLSVWDLGLKNTFQVLQEVGVYLMSVKCWLCSVGGGSSSITAVCVPLHCVGFSAYSFESFFRAWPKVFHAEHLPQGEILERNSIFNANSCGSVVLVEHMLFYYGQIKI